jgi:hypothetical protein
MEHEILVIKRKMEEELLKIPFKPEITAYSKSLKYDEPIYERLYNLTLQQQQELEGISL